MADDGAPKERRKKQRWRWTLQAHLEWQGGTATAYTTDISAIGMFVETTADIPPETAVQVLFKLSDQSDPVEVKVTGKVIRRSTPEEAAAMGGLPGLGIAFTAFTAGKKRLVQALDVAQKTGKGGKERKERRSGPRLTVGLPVRWGTEDPPGNEGRLINLASGGLFVAAKGSPSVGVRVYVTFFLPDNGKRRKVKAIARVARRDDDSVDSTVAGMAITFETSSMGDALMDILKERLASERLKPGLLGQDLSTAASTISAAAKEMDLPRIRLGGKYHVFRWKWVLGWFAAALLLYVAAYFALGSGALN